MSQFEVFRLKNGQDLKKELASYSSSNSSFVVISSVGSLSKLNLRLARGKKFLIEEGNFEIISLNGTICQGGLHLHLSVSRDNGYDLFKIFKTFINFIECISYSVSP